ncbi:MAG TPA: HAMP domain-containing sensor histidine kinase [Actinomycetota bacterium]|nr:HAMP domain-containing sensor histidine kinase [Actinomycetota bacterium]
MTVLRWGPVGALVRRPWRAGRRLLARTPLRVQLTAAVLVLVAGSLVLISVASIAVLRGSLVGRLDDQLASVADSNAHAAAEGQLALPSDQGDTGRIRTPSLFLVEVLDAGGGARGSWDTAGLQAGQSLPRLPALATLQARADTPFTVPATNGGGQWRVLVEPPPRGAGRLVVAAASLDEVNATIARLQGIDLAVSAAVLVALAGVGVAIVRASLRPLAEIERTAGQIAVGQLSRRVPERDPRTEVGRLARALNSMLAQIEAAFGARAASEAAARRSEERMRRFITDASHELRTPLTTIRGFAELYRQGGARDPAERDRLMRRIEDQAAAMGLLVEDLLLLARLDQQRPLERRPVDLLALAVDAVNDAHSVTPDRRIQLLTDGGTSGPLVVLGDQARLRQVIANLMSNALTHTPAGTPVEVAARTRRLDGALWAVVEVTDHGPGLEPEQAERVFERFYRADAARSRARGGAGLGLAIVATLVAAHQGTVQVDSSPGRGATFRVLLRLAPDATGAEAEPTPAAG